MESTCGNITATLMCSGSEENTMELTPVNTAEEVDGFIELNLPEGSEILDSEGNVVYVQDGGPDKSKIKIPSSIA